MGQLCQEAGNEYAFTNPANNQQFMFNVCGNVSYACIPQWPVYDNIGVAVQILSPPPPPSAGASCTDVFGNPAPCSGQCVVLGTEFFQFQLQNPNDPTQGVSFRHTGMPPDADDPFPCPALTPEGLTQERQLSININCDMSVPGLKVLNVTEVNPCVYAVSASSSAACPVKGDPFDCQTYVDAEKKQPGKNFGFVVLGSFLTIFVSWTISFMNRRGMLDGVKDKLKGVPVIGSMVGSSGSSSYKSISGASAAATPISASAYGTA
jgi:hypothetical protein